MTPQALIRAHIEAPGLDHVPGPRRDASVLWRVATLADGPRAKNVQHMQDVDGSMIRVSE